MELCYVLRARKLNGMAARRFSLSVVACAQKIGKVRVYIQSFAAIGFNSVSLSNANEFRVTVLYQIFWLYSAITRILKQNTYIYIYIHL